jgi:hypothetical protein
LNASFAQLLYFAENIPRAENVTRATRQIILILLGMNLFKLHFLLKTMSLIHELREHAPFTGMSAIGGILLFLFAFHVNPGYLNANSENMFHFFHPLHILFSAIATSAIFAKYNPGKGKIFAVGIFGSLSICGISDALLPFLGGTLFGLGMEWHLCLLEHWELVVPVAVIGTVFGMLRFEKASIFSHSWHVLVSTLATLLYLISFGIAFGSAWHLFATFIIVFFSVIIPCCTSDIVFPVLVGRVKR